MENLLPKDGIATYFGKVVPDPEMQFGTLMKTIEWRNDEVILFGKRIVTKRKVAWYANKNFAYTYSGIRRTALLFTPELLALKQLTEKITGETYNSCLLNLYHDGSESMGWHSDDEREIEIDSTIASLSLGAERKFAFKHKTDRTNVSVWLESGSLLAMKGPTQRHWLHSVPKSAKVDGPRINLTFRKIVETL